MPAMCRTGAVGLQYHLDQRSTNMSLLLLLCFLSCTLFLHDCHGARTAKWAPANVEKVPVDLYVMSKCPDAVFTEGALAPVLEELKDHIELTLHFIGVKQEDGSWTSKHGQTEVDGDVQQLCVQLNTPVEQRYDWMYRFVTCNDKQGMEAIGQFATAAVCLKEVGIPLGDATKILACIYGPSHTQLLEQEFALTASTGISTSATIVVDDNPICVRDGGEWKDCPAGTEPEDFKVVICGVYAMKNQGKLPEECTPPPEPTPATATFASA